MKRLFLLLLLPALLASCGRSSEPVRHAFFALGTLVEVTVFDPPADLDRTLAELEQLLLGEEKTWRAFETGELAALNAQLSRGEAVEISPPLLAGIQTARNISVESKGAFNPAIGGLVRLWGFQSEQRAAAPPPDDEALAAFLPPPTLDALRQRSDGRWESTDPQLWIDMGAFAKGLAVNAAIRLLKERGVTNAIVNAGGDLKVIGRHGDRAWRIGIRNPRGPGVIAGLQARDDESVFTSGDYERTFDWLGKRYHHILDPATGRPAEGITSATVITPDAARADAAATALIVAGPDHWLELARRLDIDKAMVILEDGRILLTPAMRERVELEPAAGPSEVVAP